jgi:hypothetical protein
LFIGTEFSNFTVMRKSCGSDSAKEFQKGEVSGAKLRPQQALLFSESFIGKQNPCIGHEFS